MDADDDDRELEVLLEAARRATWDALHGPAHLRSGRFDPSIDAQRNAGPSPEMLAAQGRELRRVLAQLAAPAAEQRAILMALGSAPLCDELGLEFDDVMHTPAAFRAREASPALHEALAAVDAELEAVPKDAWYMDALDREPWPRIRALAARALALLAPHDPSASTES